MGKRGPTPEPTAIKKVKGNPGRRPLNDREPEFPSDVPSCPMWLGAVGRAVWEQYIPVLTSVKGLLTLADGGELALLCEAWEDFLDARDEIAREGATCVSEKGGAYPHPAVGRKNAAIARIKALSAKFGLSPADRVGLKLPVAEAPDDPFVAMLKARAGRN